MANRRRSLSLPSLVNIISPKSDKVKKDPCFLWSTRKTLRKENNMLRRIHLLMTKNQLEKVAGTPGEKLPYVTPKKIFIKSKNDKFDFRNKKSLFNSPQIFNQFIINDKYSSDDQSTTTAAAASFIPDNKIDKDKRRESVQFLEEIITVNESPHEVNLNEMAKGLRKINLNEKIFLKEKEEFIEYLRLKAKYEGRLDNKKYSSSRTSPKNLSEVLESEQLLELKNKIQQCHISTRNRNIPEDSKNII